MLILLTNDDGIFAPGLAALEKELRRLGDVVVVAPATEQSGVGHSITFRTPLLHKQILRDGEHWGWAVEGTPADCVKIGITYLCDRRPDLVVSGMNIGLNAGINVLYSGTVAAAVEASFYRINSFAVSMEFCEGEPLAENVELAAKKAVQIIELGLEERHEAGGMRHETGASAPSANTESAKDADFANPVDLPIKKASCLTPHASRLPELYNVNIPLQSLHGESRVKVVPMDMNQYWDDYEQRLTPHGKPYFWLIGRPVPRKNDQIQNSDEPLTDLQAIGQGFITITPLDFDMTKHATLEKLKDQFR